MPSHDLTDHHVQRTSVSEPEFPPARPCPLRPLGARVVVLRAEEESESKLVLTPEQYRERPNRGTVVAVGPGREFPSGRVDPPPVQVGDHVVYSRYAEELWRAPDGTEFAILSQEELWLTVEHTG